PNSLSAPPQPGHSPSMSTRLAHVATSTCSGPPTRASAKVTWCGVVVGHTGEQEQAGASAGGTRPGNRRPHTGNVRLCRQLPRAHRLGSLSRLTQPQVSRQRLHATGDGPLPRSEERRVRKEGRLVESTELEY